MGARFAGSQRVGDRRRRRLAVEADDVGHAPVTGDELPAPADAFRARDAAHVGDPVADRSAPTVLSIGKIVPRERWKYAAGGLALLAVNAALTIAGPLAPELAERLGPAAGHLLAAPNGPAARWYSSLLLALAGQMALLIWWVRSHSLNDFNGRYWVWTRVAAVWMAFSGCIAVDAQKVAVELLRFVRPEVSAGWAFLSWLTPAAAIAVPVGRGLLREMRGCRASRALLWSAAASYVLAIGLSEFEVAMSPARRICLLQSSLLTGHAAIVASLWLHARHVVYFSRDPVQGTGRRWQIPRPHFRLRPRDLMARLRQRAAPAEGSPSPARQPPRREPEKRAREPQDAEAAAATNLQESVASASKPRLRIDSRHEPPAGGQRLPAAESAPDETRLDSQSSTDADEEPEENSSQPDLRGLSKKQRRRLLQELRDRERANRQGAVS